MVDVVVTVAVMVSGNRVYSAKVYDTAGNVGEVKTKVSMRDLLERVKAVLTKELKVKRGEYRIIGDFDDDGFDLTPEDEFAWKTPLEQIKEWDGDA